VTAIDSGVLLVFVPRDPSADREPQDAASGKVTDVLSEFFAIVREHTIQGMFCDPLYGGNRGRVGWRLVGFPGAQWEYTAEQMKFGYDATQIPVLSLAELRVLRSQTAPGRKGSRGG
jgi:gluconate 2-dehydrogenase gamma chain